jgi:hypothetical protein
MLEVFQGCFKDMSNIEIFRKKEVDVGIDCSFPKQSLRSSKEANGAGPAFGCRDLYEHSEMVNINTEYMPI